MTDTWAELPEMPSRNTRSSSPPAAAGPAARQEDRPSYHFAERLALHAQTEEQVSYPTTILIGKYLNSRWQCLTRMKQAVFQGGSIWIARREMLARISSQQPFPLTDCCAVVMTGYISISIKYQGRGENGIFTVSRLERKGCLCRRRP
jgi:hypothetical protein